MGLFSSLMGFTSSARPEAPALNGSLDLIASTLGRSIETARDYRSRVIPAINAAVGYFDQQVARIPGVIELATPAYRRNPFLRAAFPSQDDIRIALGRSLAVRESLPVLARSSQSHIYALLGMRCRPGEQVAGQPPAYADHTLKCLALSEADARKAICFSAFSRLVKNYDDHLGKLRFKERLLRIEWTIENDPVPALPADKAKEFVFAEQELTPDNMVHGLIAWLGRPAEHLRVLESDVCLAGERDENGQQIHYDLPVLHSADRRQWIASIVKFPLQEGVDALNQEARSHRYIFI